MANTQESDYDVDEIPQVGDLVHFRYHGDIYIVYKVVYTSRDAAIDVYFINQQGTLQSIFVNATKETSAPLRILSTLRGSRGAQ